MNLREARFDDHWRRLFAQNYPTRFTRISPRNLLCIADNPIDFCAGITAVVGSNGVGKSTLVAAIAELLANGAEVAPGHRDRVKGSVLEGVAFQSNNEIQLLTRDDGAARAAAGSLFEEQSYWLDPSQLASVCINQIHTDQNFNDLLGPIAPLKLNTDDLELASYLVNRRYSDLAIYEINDYAGFERFPYFEASADGKSYGSENMGMGELCLLLAFWTLKNAAKNSVIVLEEPETHVSPRSQNCLMNIIAKFSTEMGLWCILATHSPTIIRRVPREHIKLITRGETHSVVVNTPKYVEIARILGGGIAFKGALLVEDEEAKGFLLGIMEEFDSDLLNQFEVLNAGSVTGITSALASMPLTKEWLTLVGIYDGDQRQAQQRRTSWPIGFLPGDVAPSELLRALLVNTPEIRASLVREFGKSENDISVAMNYVEGTDHHDLVRHFSSALNMPITVARRGLFRLWLSNPDNGGLAKDFLNKLRADVDALRRE